MPLITVKDHPFSRISWTHMAFTFRHFNTGSDDAVVTAYLNGLPAGWLRGRIQTIT